MIRRILFSLIAIGVVAGAGIYYYVFVYSATHRTASSAAGIAVSADSLALSFEADEGAANAKYLKQVVRVTGVILEASTNQQGQQTLLLGNPEAFARVFVTMEKPLKVRVGERVSVKGFCDGFLSDVVITGGVPAEAEPVE